MVYSQLFDLPVFNRQIRKRGVGKDFSGLSPKGPLIFIDKKKNELSLDSRDQEATMARKGGLSSIFYRETCGMKVTGGQFVKSGTVLTRCGDRWKPGLNVRGRMHLTAACDGEVFFTKKRGSYKSAVTYINIRPPEEKAKKA